jgi:hypothetical protein
VLIEELKSQLPQLSSTLQAAVRRALRRRNTPSVDTDTVLVDVLRTWFTRNLPVRQAMTPNGPLYPPSPPKILSVCLFEVQLPRRRGSAQ